MIKGYGGTFIVFDIEGLIEKSFTSYHEALEYYEDMKALYPDHHIDLMALIQ